MQPRHMHRAPFIPENLKSTLETQLFHPLLMISPSSGVAVSDWPLVSSPPEPEVLRSYRSSKRLLKGEI